MLFATLALASQPAAEFLQGLDASALTGGPDLTKIYFHGARYVRENNSEDIAAQLKTDKTPTEVQFYIGDKNNAPVTGTKHSANEWRLQTALTAGRHTIFAEAKIDGKWHDISQQGTVYSLDVPSAGYVLPNDQKNIFRPGDNPLRLKVDDEFNQFEKASFSLYHYDVSSKTFGGFIDTFTVDREQCDMRTASRYLLCDIHKADNWNTLAQGSYAVKLQTDTFMANIGIRHESKAHWSHAFTIDNVRPVVTDFKIESNARAGGFLKVAATAEDNNQLESIKFYVTRPRDDGACTGNETALVGSRILHADADGYYRTTLDVSGEDFVTGSYCVMAVARDAAMSNSGIIKLSFIIDHTPPEATLQLTSSAMPSASTPIVMAGNVHEHDEVKSLMLYRDNGVEVADLTVDVKDDGSWAYTLTGGLNEGSHVFYVAVEDMLGNYGKSDLLQLTVGSFIIPSLDSNGEVPTTLTVSQFAPSLIVPPTVASGVTAPFAGAENQVSQDGGEVLGTETAKNTLEQSSDLPVVAATESGWKFFGVTWYWWMLIAAAVVGMSWWTLTSIRRRKAALS